MSIGRRARVLFLGSGSWSTDVLYACAEFHDVEIVTYENEASRTLARAFGPTVTEVAAMRSLPVHFETTPPTYSGTPWCSGFDFAVASNWRHRIPQHVLGRCNAPFLNIHRGALPEFAGLSPISWAVALGATETAVVAHLMNGTLDSGRHVASEKLPIGAHDTARDVYYATRSIAPRVAMAGIDRLRDSDRSSLPHLPRPNLLRLYRDGEMLRIRWTEDARSVYNLLRAQAPPFPPAFCLCDSSIVFVEYAEGFDTSSGGTPGRVLSSTDRRCAVVACGAGTVTISRVHCDPATGGTVPAAVRFTAGVVLY